VAAALHELLQDAERRRGRPTRVRVPAAEGGDVGEAVLGEEAEHLELRIDPRLESAERLQDQLVVEDDRRVRLFGADGSRLEHLPAEACEAGDGAELDRAFLPLQGQPTADRM